MSIVYKIWDRENGIYITRFNKPSNVDWYSNRTTAEHYIPILCRAWKIDEDNFEIHRYKLSMTRMKNDD